MIITAAKDLGKVIKLVRKKSKLTQAQLAAACGVGSRFIRELEQGKPSCQLDKALWVVQMLGLKLEMKFPQSFGEENL